MARITRDPIDPLAILRPPPASHGAVVGFLGVVRDSSGGRRVAAIEYEAYEAMAVREMARIEEEIREEWPSVSIDITHRIGRLRVGEGAVLVAVTSPRRAEGFAALQRSIDRLKQSVPIWKKEIYVDGEDQPTVGG